MQTGYCDFKTSKHPAWVVCISTLSKSWSTVYFTKSCVPYLTSPGVWSRVMLRDMFLLILLLKPARSALYMCDLGPNAVCVVLDPGGLRQPYTDRTSPTKGHAASWMNNELRPAPVSLSPSACPHLALISAASSVRQNWEHQCKLKPLQFQIIILVLFFLTGFRFDVILWLVLPLWSWSRILQSLFCMRCMLMCTIDTCWKVLLKGLTFLIFWQMFTAQMQHKRRHHFFVDLQQYNNNN